MIIRYAGRVLFLDMPYIILGEKIKSIIEPLKKGFNYNKQVGICLPIVISQKRCLLKPFIHMRMNIQ